MAVSNPRRGQIVEIIEFDEENSSNELDLAVVLDVDGTVGTVRLLRYIAQADLSRGPNPHPGAPANTTITVDFAATGTDPGTCFEAEYASDIEQAITALQAALFTPSYSTISRVDGTFDLGLSVNTWETLIGGSAVLAQGVSYNASTGEITVTDAGIYRASIGVTASRGGILSPQTDASLFVDGAEGIVFASAALGIAGIDGTMSSSLPLDLDAGAVLTARVRSTLALTLTVLRWSVGLDRIA
jgi:hypothetical protein